MLVILPPSETKATGGSSSPLDLSSLWLPEVTDIRSILVEALITLAGDVVTARSVLGVGAGKTAEIEGNAVLRTSPTMAALERYTGVLYDALDARGFTRAQRARANARIAIGSALFGAVRASDAIPAYRLSGSSALPALPTLRALWKPVLGSAIADAADGLVVDLRSGMYQQLGPVPGSVTATVLTERDDGSRAVVSHFNKHHKGILARALAVSRAEPSDARAVAAVARRAGLRVEVAGPTEIVVLTN